jgi:hypothetical protein
MVVEEPSWFEVDRYNDKSLEKELEYHISKNGHPSIALVILSYENQYKSIKNALYAKNIIS